MSNDSTQRNTAQENGSTYADTPTASPETEEALISGGIQGLQEALDALLFLRPEDFTLHVCATVCEANQDLIASDELVEIINIGDWLKAHGKITEDINGPALCSLAGIVDAFPHNFGKWAAIIREKAIWRNRALLWRLQSDAAARCQETSQADAAPYKRAIERLESEQSSEFMTVDELAEEPGIQYLIKGVLPEQSLAMCHAAESNLKSFVVDDMLFHIAAGIPWHGHTVKQGKVAFVLNEGGAGFYKRLRGWEKIHRVSLRGKVIVRKPKKRVPLFQLNEPDHVTKLVSSLKAEGAVIVCFDTLSSIIPGVNPNGGDGGMNAAIAHARRIRDEALVTCLFVHHNNRNNEAKGATDFIAAMDVRFSVEAKKDSKGLPTSATVHCEKPRDDTPFPNLIFSVHVVDVPTEENPHETTLVLLPDGEAAPSLPNLTPKQRSTLQALVDGMTYGEWQKAASVAGSTFNDHRTLLSNYGYVQYDEPTERYCLTASGRNLLRLLQSEQKQSNRSEATGAVLYSGYSGLSLETGVTGVSPTSLADQKDRGYPSQDVFPNHMLNQAPVNDGTAAVQSDLAAPISQEAHPAPTEPISIEAKREEKRNSGPRPAATPQAIQDESETVPRAATPAKTAVQEAPAQPEQDTPAVKRDYRDWSAAEARAWLLETAEGKFWPVITHAGVRYGGERSKPLIERRQDWTEKIRDAGPMAVQQFAHTWYSRLEENHR